MKKTILSSFVFLFLSVAILPGSLLAENKILVVTGVLEEQAVAGRESATKVYESMNKRSRAFLSGEII